MSRLRRVLACEAGYSLVELLTVMAILSVIVGAITTLFVQGANGEADMNRRFQAQQGTRLALDRMRRDIHCSGQATSATTSTLLVLSDPCAVGGYVSWCELQVGTTWKLFRKVAATCDTSGVPYASDIVNLVVSPANVAMFSYRQQSTSSLASVDVDIKTNTKPSLTQETYELKDTIVLRNSSRTCLTGGGSQVASPSPPC